MNGMYLGYNPKAAVDLMETIVKHYNDLGTRLSADWVSVKNSLRTEWVGGDEQSFEREFVKKLCGLYVQSYDLTSNCVKNIKIVLDNYIETQKNNLLDGAETNTLTYDTALTALQNQAVEIAAAVARNDNVITFSEITFADNAARGLRNATSKANIQGKISEFVEGIKNQVTGLTSSINVTSAFYGDAGTQIEKYVLTVNDAVKVVSTAVQDLNDALEKLAGTNYIELSDSISSNLSQASNNISSSVDQTVKSRWTA